MSDAVPLAINLPLVPDLRELMCPFAARMCDIESRFADFAAMFSRELGFKFADARLIGANLRLNLGMQPPYPRL